MKSRLNLDSGEFCAYLLTWRKFLVKWKMKRGTSH